MTTVQRIHQVGGLNIINMSISEKKKHFFVLTNILPSIVLSALESSVEAGNVV